MQALTRSRARRRRRDARAARAAADVPRSAARSDAALVCTAAAIRGSSSRSAALVGLGVVMVFNVSYFHGQATFGDPMHFFRKHVVLDRLGLRAGGVASRIRVGDAASALAYPLLALALVLLVAVLIPGIGVGRGGAQRWFPLGPLAFQPTEIAKFARGALPGGLARPEGRAGARLHVRRAAALRRGRRSSPCCRSSSPTSGRRRCWSCILVVMLYVGGARLLHLAALGSIALPALVLRVSWSPIGCAA